jgi:hypothetical protein
MILAVPAEPPDMKATNELVVIRGYPNNIATVESYTGDYTPIMVW